MGDVSVVRGLAGRTMLEEHSGDVVCWGYDTWGKAKGYSKDELFVIMDGLVSMGITNYGISVHVFGGTGHMVLHVRGDVLLPWWYPSTLAHMNSSLNDTNMINQVERVVWSEIAPEDKLTTSDLGTCMPDGGYKYSVIGSTEDYILFVAMDTDTLMCMELN